MAWDLNTAKAQPFACQCPACHGTGPATDPIVQGLYFQLCAMLSNTLIVSCGVRCPAHNAAVGGAPDSRHLPEHADALDIVCDNSAIRYQLVKAAIQLNFTGIEVCEHHIHLDMRSAPKILIMGAG